MFRAVLCRARRHNLHYIDNQNTRRGGNCNKQAATHSIIFIVLHTLNKFASINGDWPPLPSTPVCHAHSWPPARWQLPFGGVGGAHCWCQSISEMVGPETLARKYALMDSLLPHNCAKFHYINGGKPKKNWQKSQPTTRKTTKKAGKTFMRASLSLAMHNWS